MCVFYISATHRLPSSKMMVSEVLVFTSSGDCILTKTYQQDLNGDSCKMFQKKLKEFKSSELPPYFVEESSLYCHILRGGLHFAAVAPAQTSPVFVIDLLTRFHKLVKDFCGVVSEVAVRSNLVLVLEILDEYLNGGFIQLSTTGKLKRYIQSEPATLRHVEGQSSSLFGMEHRVVPCNAADRPVVHSRNEQEKRKNEVFIDVIERLVVAIAADGRVLRSELRGELKMKSFIAGCPIVKMSLNAEVNVTEFETLQQSKPAAGYGKVASLESCVLHESVQLETPQMLSMQPPDGEFTVMTYSVCDNLPVGLPFRVQSYIKDKPSSRDLELSLRLSCDTTTNSRAINVTLRMPLPATTTSLSQQLTGLNRGQTSQLLHTPQKLLEWKLPEVGCKTEETAQFLLVGARDSKNYAAEIGPIAMDFELSGFVCSNLSIRSVQVCDSQQSFVPLKWVRYITTADSYLIRLV